MAQPVVFSKWFGLHPFRMHHSPACRPRRCQTKSDQAVASGSFPSQQGDLPEGCRLRRCCDETAGGALVFSSPAGDFISNKTYSFTKELILKLIHLYKNLAASGVLSSAGLVSPACRYLPTCSDYGLESLQKQGLLRGTALLLRRLMRCHPLATGGWDPVP